MMNWLLEERLDLEVVKNEVARQGGNVTPPVPKKHVFSNPTG